MLGTLEEREEHMKNMSIFALDPYLTLTENNGHNVQITGSRKGQRSCQIL